MYIFGVCGGALELLRSAGLDGISFRGAAMNQDALLIMPGEAAPSGTITGTLVAPPDVSARAAHCVTYGLGTRESVTYSSISGDWRVLSLQRELITLSGRRVERQEVPLVPAFDPEWQLAISSALITGGMPPVRLCEFWTHFYQRADI